LRKTFLSIIKFWRKFAEQNWPEGKRQNNPVRVTTSGAAKCNQLFSGFTMLLQLCVFSSIFSEFSKKIKIPECILALKLIFH
jgi:hypothetical protein